MTIQWVDKSYPKHAGEANPGPGPPCQSGGQRQSNRGHPKQSATLQAHGKNPQYSQKFPVVPRKLRWHRSMPDVRGARRVGTGTLLSFSLSVGLSQSPSSELPPCLALPPPVVLLTLSLTSAFPLCPSWSVVTLFHGEKGGGESWLYFSLSKLPSPQMILVSPSFPFSLFMPSTHTRTIHWPPSTPLASPHTLPLLPSTSLLQACSLMSALMSLQFFIGFQICSPSKYLQDSPAALGS